MALVLYKANTDIQILMSDRHYGSYALLRTVRLYDLGIGNNPMVGCTVACAVDVATALNN